MDMKTSSMEYSYESYEQLSQDSNNYKVEQNYFADGYDILDKDDWTKTAYANDLENLAEMQEILEIEKELIEQEMIEEK